jgi:hypothetical protein
MNFDIPGAAIRATLEDILRMVITAINIRPRATEPAMGANQRSIPPFSPLNVLD